MRVAEHDVALRQQLHSLLDLLHNALHLHTCALLLSDENGQSMRLVDAVSGARGLCFAPIPAGTGVIGAIVARRAAILLSPVHERYRGLHYYEAPLSVRHFFGVPILEDGEVRGVLCADRRDEGGNFDAAAQTALLAAASQVVFALRNQRALLQLGHAKQQQDILYRASCALGAAVDAEAAMTEALNAVAEVVTYDFAAVTSYDATSANQFVTRAVGVAAANWQGQVLDNPGSLCALAVQTRHYLPYRSQFDPQKQAVLTHAGDFPGYGSLLILPLIVAEQPIGTLVLGARRGAAFGLSMRHNLQVLANQLAVSLANAASLRRLEEMATTDPLTGCLNKRAFLQQMEQKLRAAERFGRQASLIMIDIDHFKRVNDQYGHSTGDRVIQALGAILKQMKRETDIVGRFGGEEFCVLCEQTDAEGARRLAERIRVELSQRRFAGVQALVGSVGDSADVHVTCSLGIATASSSGESPASLFERADRALYEAKASGRNTVRSSRARVLRRAEESGALR